MRTQSASSLKVRSIQAVVSATTVMEGAGMLVHRSFPTAALDMFDPFPLLDELGPKAFAPAEAPGFPDHPHRGFETVTYVLQGGMQHKDSRGHAGKLGPGDVQWMTAGSGIVHSEMPEEEFTERGGLLHGFQLWVNLPAKNKMMPPRYQEVAAAGIPAAVSEDGLVSVQVVAGGALGVRAVIDTVIPISYLHFTLQPGGSVVQPLPDGANAFAYVFQGAGRFGDAQTTVERGNVVLFGTQGEAVHLEAPVTSVEPLSLLLIAGRPIGEPVARYGPFVMNTREEIAQAMDDYRNGRMGAITI
ncbi:MAG: pirin family protein [Dehalococcoidia bacterium]|nr:pirin family protein [Dehalococcoidia bacterium]